MHTVFADDEAAADGAPALFGEEGGFGVEGSEEQGVGVLWRDAVAVEQDVVGAVERDAFAAAERKDPVGGDVGDDAVGEVGVDGVGDLTGEAEDDGLVGGVALAGPGEGAVEGDDDAGGAVEGGAEVGGEAVGGAHGADGVRRRGADANFEEFEDADHEQGIHCLGIIGQAAFGWISCSRRWRSSGVTFGVTPNQRAKPGTAWWSSMPRPSTVRRPRLRAWRRSGGARGP